MAGTTVPATPTGMPGSDVEALRLQLNRAVDDLETVRASLAALRTTTAAVITAAATSIAAVAAVTAPAAAPAASALTAAKVATNTGATT